MNKDWARCRSWCRNCFRGLKVCLVRSRGDVDLPMSGLGFLRLVVLRQALSDIGGANPHHRVFGGIVVRRSTEYFDSDQTFSEGIFGARQSVLDNEPKQILALAAGPKGNAAEDLLHGCMDFQPGRCRDRLNERIVLTGHSLSG